MQAWGISTEISRELTWTPIAIVSSAWIRRCLWVPREATWTSRMSPVSRWRRRCVAEVGRRV
jgi:hypothetical protein